MDNASISSGDTTIEELIFNNAHERKINIPYAIFKTKLSTSLMSAISYFLLKMKLSWNIMKNLSRKSMRLLSQHRRTQFEKSQDIIDEEVGIGSFNMESLDTNILKRNIGAEFKR